MNDTPCIIIAGGGTGGHVFPGIAVADALRGLADVEVIFAGSPRGIERGVVPGRGYRLELLDVRPMKGGGAPRMVSGAFFAARAMVKAMKLIRTLKPSAVLSVGGYAAGPMAMAAVLRGIPVAIFEPNGVLGLTNRILAPFAKRGYVAWPAVAAKLRAGVARELGVPLRAGFEPSPYVPRGHTKVLVMGGSLGAKALNEKLPSALARLAKEVPSLSVLHQTGKGADGEVRALYNRLGLAADVQPFLDDVAGAIADADLVIARSGAGTVAEIAAVGRAAVYLPFPFAADDHQRKNAKSMERAGGAVCLPQADASEARLVQVLGGLLRDDARRTAMADAARGVGRPHAAHDVAGDLLRLAGVPLIIAKTKTNGHGGPSRSAMGAH